MKGSPVSARLGGCDVLLYRQRCDGHFCSWALASPTPGTVPGVPASGRDVHLIETVYVRCPPAPWRSSQSSTHVWAGHSPALSPTRDRLTQNKKASVTCRLLESLISVPMPAERLA